MMLGSPPPQKRILWHVIYPENWEAEATSPNRLIDDNDNDYTLILTYRCVTLRQHITFSRLVKSLGTLATKLLRSDVPILPLLPLLRSGGVHHATYLRGPQALSLKIPNIIVAD